MDSGFEVFLYAAVDGCSAHKGKRLYKGISEYLEKACQMVYLEYCGIWTILRTAFSRCDIWRKLVYRSCMAVYDRSGSPFDTAVRKEGPS